MVSRDAPHQTALHWPHADPYWHRTRPCPRGREKRSPDLVPRPFSFRAFGKKEPCPRVRSAKQGRAARFPALLRSSLLGAADSRAFFRTLLSRPSQHAHHHRAAETPFVARRP